MASGQGWGCSGSSYPVNAQVNGESTDGRRQRLWVWKRLALALSCGWPAWEEAGSGREESRSDGPGKKKQIWLAVACVASCRPPPLLITARPPGTTEMSGWRRLQLREACPVSQPGWGRADPRGMQASPCDRLGPTKPKCSCCLQSLF